MNCCGKPFLFWTSLYSLSTYMLLTDLVLVISSLNCSDGRCKIFSIFCVCLSMIPQVDYIISLSKPFLTRFVSLQDGLVSWSYRLLGCFFFFAPNKVSLWVWSKKLLPMTLSREGRKMDTIKDNCWEVRVLLHPKHIAEWPVSIQPKISYPLAMLNALRYTLLFNIDKYIIY